MHRATVLALAEQRVRVQRDVRGARREVGSDGSFALARKPPRSAALSHNWSAIRASTCARRCRAAAIALVRYVSRAPCFEFARDATLCPRAIAASKTALLAEPRNAASNGRIPDRRRRFRRAIPARVPARPFPDTAARAPTLAFAPTRSESCRQRRGREDIIVGVVLEERRGRACSARPSPDPVHVRQAPAVLLGIRGQTLQGTLDQIVRGEIGRGGLPPSP